MVAEGTQVSLTATAKFGSDFVNWTGCNGVPTNPCNVTILSNTVVTATFDIVQPVPPRFNVEYEASSGLRPDEVCPAWDMFAAGSPAPGTVKNGILTIATTQNAENLHFGHVGQRVSIPDPLVIEARMRGTSRSRLPAESR